MEDGMTTIDLDAWREECVEKYCADAASGKNTDWAEYCENSSMEVLVKVYALLQEDKPVGSWQEARGLIEDLITKAAEHHADSLLDDCCCYAPQPHYNTVSPPEPMWNRNCPVHGRHDL